MDIKVYNQGGSTNDSSKKLYSQDEVNALLKNETSKTSSIAEEAKREDKAVADLVKKSNRIILSIASYHFPFNLFPDIINIEEGRITIINRHLFSSEVHSIDIKDISNIFINTVVFFSQLDIVSKTFEKNEIKVANLRIKDAILARRIIEGLRVFVSKDIDTSGYTTEELLSKLKELSTTEIVT